jgi:acetyl/propionyl-CoA carboxylase alpha subunit
MRLDHVLIANRGEVAIRIARSAADLGITTSGIAAADDRDCAHRFSCDRMIDLDAAGARAYLDYATITTIAKAVGAQAIHPGYGFLSESAAFARQVAEAGLIFVGPSPETLQTLGDKAAARALAVQSGVSVLDGTSKATSLAESVAFFDALPSGHAMMIKAVAGGGGRGIRMVTDRAAIADAYARCQSEAASAFGVGDVYVEQAMLRARHIEVQIIGDGTGTIAVLGERECTLQRRHQKLIEIAPSPFLHKDLRENLHAAARTMAQVLRYKGLGTFEFLVDARSDVANAAVAFIEANARLQVEHAVTEAIYDLDLVALQFRIASGGTLAELGLAGRIAKPAARMALQARINSETMAADGSATPATGTLSQLRLPGGPGVRVDTHAYDGYAISPSYDSLLAKVIVTQAGEDFPALLRKAGRALASFDVQGVATNVDFLRALLASPDLQTNAVTTRYIDGHAGGLVEAASTLAATRVRPAARGATVSALTWQINDDTMVSPLPGSILNIAVSVGDIVSRGMTLAVIESMKMEHLIEAMTSGRVVAIHIASRDVVREGQPLFDIERMDDVVGEVVSAGSADPTAIRPDLQSVIDRYAFTHDTNRPEAIAKRHKLGMRSARENLADLLDAESFIEYGALAIAAQRQRRSVEDLMRNTPADGLITGLGTVNAAHTAAERARVAVMAYDYTVLAGTQGKFNHRKSDRLLDVAEQWQLPIVLFAEGGGGRPGDTDFQGVAGLSCTTFHRFARLSGAVPRVGIVAGRCFAGNAALLGSADVVIATRNASIGMGGPAMIEGGGLGVYAPDEVGPVDMQGPNGVIDVLVEDEAEAVAATKQYLGYFQGDRTEWSAPDQRLLRSLIPENRLRVYDIRTLINGLCDTGSVLELRRDFGIGAVTSLVRIGGKPCGLIANNPKHLGGAIDAPACDKIARFLQLCDAFGLPIVSLCDTPGFMVGPASERTAMVRKTSRLFVIGSSLRVPMFTIVLRKGYGLGAQAMAAGSFHAPLFNIAWPTGEFGAMGLEGAVRLGFRKELEAAPESERQALFDDLVAKSYEKGKAINMASYLEIDAVIDPQETRRWILRGIASIPATLPARRAIVDTW